MEKKKSYMIPQKKTQLKRDKYNVSIKFNC